MRVRARGADHEQDVEAVQGVQWKGGKEKETVVMTMPKPTPTPIPVRFRHQHDLGKRLIGWEQLCVKTLAEELGTTAGHLRAVLTGRRQMSLRLMREISQALKMPMTGEQSLLLKVERLARLARRKR